MNNISKKNKKLIKLCIAISLFIFIVAIIIILAFRYSVEGESNLPFQITSIRVVSTAQGNSTENSENKWDVDIIQKNDFYFYIEKNSDNSKDDAISKVTFENFKIEKSPNKGTVELYRPATATNSTLYYYTPEYKMIDSISYTGTLSTNLPALEISNQGGLIGFSIALKDLGNFISNDDLELVHDGTLLSKLGLTQDDISIKISFDVIIETSSNNKFKTTLKFDLPTGNIIETGTEILDKTDLNDLIFKRF